MLERLRGFGELAVRGFVANNAPAMFKGVMIEFLRNTTVDEIIDRVNKNKSLWSLVPQEEHDKIRHLAQQIQNTDWLTAEWAIDAIRRDHPAIASLFLGWTKSRNWLERQCNEIRENLFGDNDADV